MFLSLSIFLQTCMIFCFLIVIHNCIIDPTGTKLDISAGHCCSYSTAGVILDKGHYIGVEICIVSCSTMLNSGCQLCAPVVISRAVHASQMRVWASCPLALLGNSVPCSLLCSCWDGSFLNLCAFGGGSPHCSGAHLCWHFLDKISPFIPTYLDF